MQKWADSIKTVQDERINLAIVAANNHYAGFGPGTVNIFRNMIVLPEAKWEEKEEEGQKHLEEYPASDSKQRTLSDFLNWAATLSVRPMLIRYQARIELCLEKASYYSPMKFFQL